MVKSKVWTNRKWLTSLNLYFYVSRNGGSVTHSTTTSNGENTTESKNRIIISNQFHFLIDVVSILLGRGVLVTVLFDQVCR
jgi:hypothetical protein